MRWTGTTKSSEILVTNQLEVLRTCPPPHSSASWICHKPPETQRSIYPPELSVTPHPGDETLRDVPRLRRARTPPLTNIRRQKSQLCVQTARLSEPIRLTDSRKAVAALEASMFWLRNDLIRPRQRPHRDRPSPSTPHHRPAPDDLVGRRAADHGLTGKLDTTPRAFEVTFGVVLDHSCHPALGQRPFAVLLVAKKPGLADYTDDVDTPLGQFCTGFGHGLWSSV